MNLHEILIFGLIAIDALLIIMILLQQREGGLSTVFGGSGAIYRQRRGMAKWIYYLTVTLAVLFVVISVAVLFIT
jgi:protein translocase SecG subunit